MKLRGPDHAAPHGGTNPQECPRAVEITKWRDLAYGRRYICGCPLDDWPVSLEK